MGEQFLLALRRLPDDMRRVVFEVVIAERTLTEAAATLGISPSDAATLYVAAITHLRRMLPNLP